MSGLSAFKSVRTVGTVLPSEALTRAVDLRMPGQKAADYQFPPGMAVNAAIARAWEAMLAAHREWSQSLDHLPPGEPATKITREKWLLPLLYELGWGRPDTINGGLDVAPGLGETSAPHFPISHRLAWPNGADPQVWVPLHLLGGRVPLDTRMQGIAARAPQSMMQDYLNREERALWGILSNGRSLRLLRDASALAKQSYVEFDLDDIFANQRYADFRLLFLTTHASRFAPRQPMLETPTSASGTDHQTETEIDSRPETCWLETWRSTAIADGARALDSLREGVAAALTHLGNGFVSYSGNHKLRNILADAPDADRDLHRALLRIAYRLIVLFVAEDRDLLHTDEGSTPEASLYTDYFSTARLRRLAATRAGTRHFDLWESHQIVTDALAGDGLNTLGLHGLGADLFSRDFLGVLAGARLPNRNFLAAVRALSEIIDPATGIPRPVDYRNLDSEELGGVYEGVLAYVPHYNPVDRLFTFLPAPGNERKTSGSFYTGTPLIGLILSDALDPLIENAIRSENPERELLLLTVCDPACGSGHFLVAAARRIARALATVRTGDSEPSVSDVRSALADVVRQCIYGVDQNDLAIEIAKVALWLETIQPGKPLAFLDAHLRVGNALIGTAAELVQENVPDSAFTAVTGDDKTLCTALRKQNKRERETGQMSLFGGERLQANAPAVSNQARELESVLDDDLAAVRSRADAWRRLEQDEELLAAKRLADAWCVAFLQRKNDPSVPAITHATLTQLQDDADSVPQQTKDLIEQLARQYRLFHWHLEFPAIFANPVSRKNSAGFSAIIGNPPWDTLSPDTREFFGELVPGIRTLSKNEKDKRISDLLKEEKYARRWDEHKQELFATVHFLKRSGRYTMYAKGSLGKGDFNVYRSFTELALTHTKSGGFAGQVTPSGIYAGANSSAIREEILNSCTWKSVYGFNNKGGTWFPGVTLENFAAYTAQVDVQHAAGHSIEAAFGMHKPNNLATDLLSRKISFKVDDIIAQNPDTFAIPDIRDPRAARISQYLYRTFDAFGKEIKEVPFRDFSREIDMSDKNNVFQETGPGVPIYEGRMIDFFDHRAKRYVSGHGNSSVWEETPFESMRKDIIPQWHVGVSDLQNEAVRTRISHYRIGFMDIADPGRQRAFVSAYIPPDTVCGHTVPTIKFNEHEWYGPVYLSIANSLVLDFLTRQRTTSKHLTFSILDSLPIPRLAPNDIRSAWLAEAALKLTCTSREMTPLWNQMAEFGWVNKCDEFGIPGEVRPQHRRSIRAEIDAFVAYEIFGLERQDVAIILESFTQLAAIERPKYGTYLTEDLVLDSYDRRPWKSKL